MTKPAQTSFLSLSVGKRTRTDAFLDTMDKVVPLAGLCAVISEHYAVIEKRRPCSTDAEDAPRKALNRLKSSFRCAVEFLFRIVKRLWGHDHTRYLGIAKNASWLTMSFTIANLYLCRRDLLKRTLPAVA